MKFENDLIDRIYRAAIHTPHGVASMALLTSMPFSNVEGIALAMLRCVASFLWTTVFVVYELDSDTHKRDESWKDIYGWLCGAAGWMIFMWIRSLT